MKRISRILVAYDGSSCSEAALQDLKRAGLPATLEALVVTVADLIVPPPDEELPDSPAIRIREVELHAKAHADKAIKEARSFAQRAIKQLTSDFPAWQVSTEVECDSPAWAVIRLASRFEADLIVAGSHGHSSAGGRLILGSVSQRIVHEAGTSVRVSRRIDQHRDGPARIVVGFNGSHDSEAAIDAVISREWPPDSQVCLITVNDATAPELQKNAIEKLRSAGLTTSEIRRSGVPGHVLIKEADEWQADSIFVGTRNLHGFRHILQGSVSEAVTARAHCSVEVVRQPRVVASTNT